MNLHEFQAKALFESHGVPVQAGVPVTEAGQVAAAFAELDSELVVVKSQIHAGGRGKGTVWADQAKTRKIMDGGVKLARSAEEAVELTGKMLGNWLETKQTAGVARRINTVYLVDGVDLEHEFYCSVLLDRSLGRPVVVACKEGGVDIEEVAESRPEAIVRVHFDPDRGLEAWQARHLALAMGLEGKLIDRYAKTAIALSRCFLAADADLIEVNPLVVTTQQQVLALDAKVSIDDNALFRHADLAAMRDPDEEDPAELEAKEHGMAFVKLDGNIGCLVNGAGLAMATMDAIAIYGAEHRAFPANFLDVGGGADAQKVATAFKLILRDPSVEAILVNIFGGIMKCDTIAAGVLTAVEEVGLDRPLVVRLEGTNVEAGKKLLAESDLAVIAADDLRDGCAKAAAAAVDYRAKKA